MGAHSARSIPTVQCHGRSLYHGLVTGYIDNKAELTCKGTLRQVFIRVYTGDTFSHVGIFDPALGTVAPLSFFLVELSPPPSPPFPL